MSRQVYLGKLTLYWCDSCNVPVLGKKCARCGATTRYVDCTPPGDIRPAFKFDIDLINSAMSTAVGLVKDKPIKLHTVVPENLPLAHADNTRVRQILINFMSNAAKFTDEGEIVVDVGVKPGAGGRPEILVSVTDSGPGIAPEDLSKLFQPFSQVDDSPIRKTRGTGLGLSISHGIVADHGGKLVVESVQGGHTKVLIDLPAAMNPEGE